MHALVEGIPVLKRLDRDGWLLRLAFGAALSVAAIGADSVPAIAQNLVSNGTFQVTNGTTSFQFGTFGPYSSSESLNGWASTGYNFVYIAGQTTAAGYYGNVSLAQQSTFKTASGYPGGNYIALDSDYGAQAVTQSINGLVSGVKYVVSFAWAGAQQLGASGSTTDYLTVNLGTNSQTAQSTQTLNVPSQGFSGWMTQTFSFVATTSTEVLSFLATGTNNPPFILVANVSLTRAPEPASIVVLLTGLAGLVGVSFARRNGRPHSARV